MRRMFWRLFPLQPAGVLFLLLALGGGFVFAPGQVDAVAYAASVTLLVLLGACFLNTALAAVLLRLRLRSVTSTALTDAQVGVASRTGLALPSLRWPLVDWTLAWEAPMQVRASLVRTLSSFEEEITPLVRGRCSRIVRRFRVEDSFGLTAFSFAIAREQSLRFAPASATINATTATSFTTGGDWSHQGGPAEGDLIEMRQYGPGDPLRRVLWKTYARSRRLLVRMPEAAWAESQVSVAFFVAGENDEATAAVARAFVERGLLGRDFLFAADGAISIAHTPADAVEQIIDSVHARAKGGAALNDLAAKMEPGRLSASVVFAPATAGPWVAQVIAFAHQRPVTTTTVLIGCEIDLTPPLEQSRAQRLFLQSLDDPSRVATRALRDQLLAAGLRVQIVHRETGLQL